MVPRHYGIRTERYKLMHFYQFGEEWELYDLETDPDELTNIYGRNEYAQLSFDLKNQLSELQRHYEDDSDISEKSDAWKAEMRGSN
jgi:arylsulfatase A-like enzyme